MFKMDTDNYGDDGYNDLNYLILDYSIDYVVKIEFVHTILGFELETKEIYTTFPRPDKEEKENYIKQIDNLY
jgi:hypothetical protein